MDLGETSQADKMRVMKRIRRLNYMTKCDLHRAIDALQFGSARTLRDKCCVTAQKLPYTPSRPFILCPKFV